MRTDVSLSPAILPVAVENRFADDDRMRARFKSFGRHRTNGAVGYRFSFAMNRGSQLSQAAKQGACD
jgi:hypothetical protein